MHSRDTTVLTDLLWFNVVHYSSLFQYFFLSTMVPTLVENSYFFSVLVKLLGPVEALVLAVMEIQAFNQLASLEKLQ